MRHALPSERFEDQGEHKVKADPLHEKKPTGSAQNFGLPLLGGGDATRPHFVKEVASPFWIFFGNLHPSNVLYIQA